MINDPFAALSAVQRDATRAALTAAFGSAPIEAVASLKGGISGASIFRFEVAGRPYVVRVEGTPSPLRNPNQYVCLRQAADAGLAPRLHHVDEAGRVAVMDFVEQRPLRTYPGGRRALAHALGGLLARLQAAPLFPYFVDYPDIVARLFNHVRRTGLFAPGLLDVHAERLAHLAKACAWQSVRWVSSHNDPVPQNILFDGDRLWLIDWESAYRSDPLVDVAIVLDGVARSPELETEVLRAWLGRPPDDAVRARLALIRGLTRLYYAGVFLSASAAAPHAKPDDDLGTPTLAAFREAVRDGRLGPGTRQGFHVMGKMFLASFLSGAETPEFDIATSQADAFTSAG
ncbi:MAG TPA: phosphotransferase [Vineibacter sp.]|nr:phosphotransferase [Vineibacter sp.]